MSDKIDFDEKLYTGLSQPLEGKIGYSDELLGTMIGSTYWKISKKKIYEMKNTKTGETIEEYIGTFKNVLKEIESTKK